LTVSQSIRWTSWLILWSFAHPSLASSETTTIYRLIDENGVLYLTNKTPKNPEKALYARSYVIQTYLPPPVAVQVPKQEYASMIETVALRNDLHPALLHAMIKVESGYNPNATSPKGAVGLMQLMPATAKRYGVADRTDPAKSIEGGAHYLRDLLDLFNEDISLALAAYNAGEQTVKRYGNAVPPFRETKKYVAQVTALYRQYLRIR